jgi:AcrR family transcriptional regulator
VSDGRTVFDTSPSASRREQLLSLAARLFAERGYHAVGIDDIGEAAGVTGPAIYRHFASKSALLVALFNTLTDQLVNRAAEIVNSSVAGAEALRQLVRYQTQMCVYDRAVIAVYLSEFRSLPEDEQLALRLKQRAYIFDWMRSLGRVHPGHSEAELRALVQAAISAAQSVVYYRSLLTDEELIELVATAVEALLDIPAAEPDALVTVSGDAGQGDAVK